MIILLYFGYKTEREREGKGDVEKIRGKRRQHSTEYSQDKAVNNNFSPIITIYAFWFLLLLYIYYMQTHTYLLILLFLYIWKKE